MRKRRRYRCRETGKVKFSSFLAAHCRAGTLREHGEEMHAYRCRHCGSWHIGHSPEERQRSRSAKEEER